MKIKSMDFRVWEGDGVNLKKWPTKVDPVYKSREQYHELLGQHVATLSLQQQLLYTAISLRSPADLSGDGCGRQRRRHQARDVRHQPPRLPGVQFQASKPNGIATRLSVAHHS